MSRTPEEAKQGLDHCINGTSCRGCPYCEDCAIATDCNPMHKVLQEYIQQLEADLEDMTTRYKIADDCAKKKGEMNEKLYAELSAVKAERDALLHDLSFNLAGSGYVCDVCKHAATDTNDPPCNRCFVIRNGIDSCFEWRGAQKEEST